MRMPQQQKLPDAPAPQNNAPAPNVNVPPPEPLATRVRLRPVETRKRRQILATRQQQSGQTNPQPPPPGSQEIKTVPAGSVPNAGESGSDELLTLTKTVSFVTVPVTVKDDEGKLVDGLLAKDFSIYEDGIQQKLTLLHQRSVSAVRRADHRSRLARS